MSKNFIGLLPTGNAPSTLKAEILEMVKTNAPAEELANRVAALESGASDGGVQVVDNGNGTITLTL